MLKKKLNFIDGGGFITEIKFYSCLFSDFVIFKRINLIFLIYFIKVLLNHKWKFILL